MRSALAGCLIASVACALPGCASAVRRESIGVRVTIPVSVFYDVRFEFMIVGGTPTVAGGAP